MQTQAPHQILPKPLPNGDIQTNGLKHIPKKILPPFHDTRSDLMKSIRDGKLKKINYMPMKKQVRIVQLGERTDLSIPSPRVLKKVRILKVL